MFPPKNNCWFSWLLKWWYSVAANIYKRIRLYSSHQPDIVHCCCNFIYFKLLFLPHPPPKVESEIATIEIFSLVVVLDEFSGPLLALLTKIPIAHQGENQVNYFGHNLSRNLPRLQVVLVLVLGLERAPAGSYYLCSLSILLCTLAAFAILCRESA